MPLQSMILIRKPSTSPDSAYEQNHAYKWRSNQVIECVSCINEREYVVSRCQIVESGDAPFAIPADRFRIQAKVSRACKRSFRIRGDIYLALRAR